MANSLISINAEQLVEHELLRGESPAAVEWLLDSMEERRLQSGDVLLETGEENKRFYLIFEGSVRVELEVEGKIAITELTAGGCVGELSVLDEKGSAAHVVADQPTMLMAIKREDVWRLINRSHIFARNLLHTLSSRVRNDNDSLGESLLLQRRCEESSRIDFLTGLFNRRWLDEMLPRLVERSMTGNSSMGLMLLDIDHFKNYNDSYGHLAGDEALRMVAATIINHIRPTDSAVRYGGEEFLVLLPETGKDDAVAGAERIRQAIGELSIKGEDGNLLPGISISIGVTTTNGGGQDREGIAIADRALYQAKSSGRDRVVFYNK